MHTLQKKWQKNLIDVDDLSRKQVDEILALTKDILGDSNHSNHNVEVVNKTSSTVPLWVTFFLEPSTRTKLSFQRAIQLVGHQFLDFVPETSSLKKLESMDDTILTLSALGAKGIIIRTSDHDQLVELASKHSQLVFLNAGSGKKAHPTQALLDLSVVSEHFSDLNPRTVTYVGDITNSRVASSGIKLFQEYGWTVQVSGPDSWIPDADILDARAIKKVSAKQAYLQSDVIIGLRAQLERGTEFVGSESQYYKEFGFHSDHLSTMKPDAIYLHPGPYRSGVDLDSDLLQHKACKVLRQVTVGVALRTACLKYWGDK